MNYYRIHACENDSERLDSFSPLYELCAQGEPFEIPKEWKVISDSKGKLYDWIGGFSWWPFVAEAVKLRLGAMLGENVQWHGPFPIREKTYFLLNCVTVLDCAMEGSNSNKLFLDKNVIKEALIFRPKGFLKDLICSQVFKEACEKHGETGIRFGKIRDNGWEEFPF